MNVSSIPTSMVGSWETLIRTWKGKVTSFQLDRMTDIVLQSCSWLPVDSLASTIVDLTFSESPTTILNIENPIRFHWTKDLLPALHNSGLKFEAVSPQQWLQKLTEYEDSTPAEQALESNPAVKLLDYFVQLVDTFPGFEGGSDVARPEVTFDTSKAQKCSKHLQTAPDVLSTGLIDKFLSKWMSRWQKQ